MNNPNPFLPQGSFLEQKNKARSRMRFAVLCSISLSVVVLLALLIQGCRKPNDVAENPPPETSNSVPELPTNPPPETNVAQMPPPAPETNLPVQQTPPPPPPPMPSAPTTEDYTVIKGDTFATIAKKSGVSVRAVQEANPGVDPKRLKIGQKLHIPAGGSAAAPGGNSPVPMAAAPEASAAGGEQTYKVKSGDTLTSIAKHFHVSIKAIQSANKLGTTSIKVGQTLKIPAGAAPAAPVPAPMTESAPPPPPAPVTTAPAPGVAH